MSKPEKQTQFVTDTSGNLARPALRRKSTIVDRWVREGGPLFHPEARLGIERCERLWAAQPTLGKLTASYGEHRQGGARSFEERIEGNAADELRELSGMFPSASWRAFDAMVRDGESAGKAARFVKVPAGQASMLLQAIVGQIATIAARR